jgi:hypothetical protein
MVMTQELIATMLGGRRSDPAGIVGIYFSIC